MKDRVWRTALFDRHGKLLVGYTGGFLEAWKLDSGQAEQLWGKDIQLTCVTAFALSPSGRLLAVSERGSRHFEVLDTRSGEVVGRSKADVEGVQPLSADTEDIHSFCWAGGDDVLVTLVEEKNVSIWRREGSTFDLIASFAGNYQRVSSSKDGQSIAAASYDRKQKTHVVERISVADGRVGKTWRLKDTGEESLDGSAPRLFVFWDAKGDVLVSGSRLGVCKLANSGAVESVLTVGEVGQTYVPSMSPSLQRIVFIGRQGVKVRDMDSGEDYLVTYRGNDARFFGEDRLMLNVDGERQVWERRRPEGVGIWAWPQGMVALGIAIVAVVLIVVETVALRRPLRARSGGSNAEGIRGRRSPPAARQEPGRGAQFSDESEGTPSP